MSNIHLNHQSTQLYDFIHTLPYGISKFPYHKYINPNSKSIVHTIYKKILQGFISYDKTLFTQIPYPDFTKSELIDTIPEEIRSHILQSNSYTKSFSFQIRERIIHINMMFPGQVAKQQTTNSEGELRHFTLYQTNKFDKYIQNALKMIYMWFSIATQYSSDNCSKKLN
jgi:hypothetical protein